MNKIKVCHILNKLETGGMENGVVNICNNLDRELFQPVILCVKGRGAMTERLKQDVQVYCLNCPEGKAPFRFVKIANILRKIKPHIAHTHGWGACSFDGILGARLTGVPIVINGEHGTFFLKKHQVFIQRILSYFCDVISPVSDSLKREVIDKLGIKETKIKVILNGVDLNIFDGKHDIGSLKRKLQEKYKIPIDANILVVGSIGSLKALKNQKMLIKAIDAIKTNSARPKILVLFVGHGHDHDFLQKMVRDLGLSQDIFFLGQRDDIPRLLSFTDVLVSTSRSEGLSNVFLEAMASRVPVIATRSPGTGNIIKEGKNGFLVELGDIKA